MEEWRQRRALEDALAALEHEPPIALIEELHAEVVGRLQDRRELFWDIDVTAALQFTNVMHRAGGYAQAADAYQLLLNRVRRFGPADSELGIVRSLAGLLADLGRFDEVDVLCDEAHALLEAEAASGNPYALEPWSTAWIAEVRDQSRARREGGTFPRTELVGMLASAYSRVSGELDDWDKDPGDVAARSERASWRACTSIVTSPELGRHRPLSPSESGAPPAMSRFEATIEAFGEIFGHGPRRSDGRVGGKTDDELELMFQALREAMDELPGRERRIAELRFGLEDGRIWSFDRIAASFAIKPKQAEATYERATRKLRHPSRARKMKHLL